MPSSTEPEYCGVPCGTTGRLRTSTLLYSYYGMHLCSAKAVAKQRDLSSNSLAARQCQLTQY
eukprot:scaffold72308_cov27-Tisochrysis_lutea.AAC.2